MAADVTPAPRSDSASSETAPTRQEAPSDDTRPQASASAETAPTPSAARNIVFIARHSLTVRATHWLNAVILAIMLMSGLQIFNAHPALYWGARSDFERPLFAMKAETAADGALVGVTTLFGYRAETTGVLGVSSYRGKPEPRGFPAWITLPGARWLSMGRTWHFFFAWLFVLNGFAYIAYTLIRGHLRRDLLPTKEDLRRIGRTIADHIRFRFHKGEEARHYNVLQKLAYLGVVFILGPLVVITGLSMSPTLNAAMPWLPEIFGGRQSARTIHFLCAAGFVAFFLVHIFMVLVSGVWNNIRSMITGRYAIRATGEGHGH
jgi:thiosulfate reductase cytochrome b subunit